MFEYTDPTGTNLLESEDALTIYRKIVHEWYRQLAALPNSAFTLLEAFQELITDANPDITNIPWIAFPITANASFDEIDNNRITFQDEYVEWRTEKDDSGNVKRVTFTTEFPQYYEALANKSTESLIRGIVEVIPGSNPTIEELFGSNLDPDSENVSAEGRAFQFLRHIRQNPWNNGEKDILFLTQRFNTIGALFNLAGHCAIPRTDIEATAVCANIGGFCGPGRNSDPSICQAAQNLARFQNGLSLQDPVGVKIMELQGIWKIDGQQIDINDKENNENTWNISRNGRRGVLNVLPNLTIGDDPITTGTQVATKLLVGADVISTSEENLPTWAKMGHEISRNIV